MTTYPDILLLEPEVFHDERGFFMEQFHTQKFCAKIGYDVHFVQDNFSKSHKSVLRGLHLQRAPHQQAKLIQVLHGEVFDVVVDVRPHSPQFGKWSSVILSGENKRQLYIPEGFAHGFLALSEGAYVHYKTTAHYSPKDEMTLCWNDPDVGIKWPNLVGIILSEKDKNGLSLQAFNDI